MALQNKLHSNKKKKYLIILAVFLLVLISAASIIGYLRSKDSYDERSQADFTGDFGDYVKIYVDKNNIGGPCSDSYSLAEADISHPFCSIKTAIAKLPDDRAGYVIFIREGTYRPSRYPIYITHGSSDADRPFVISAYQDEEVTLTIAAESGEPEAEGQYLITFACYNCSSPHAINNVRIQQLHFTGLSGYNTEHYGQIYIKTDSSSRFSYDNLQFVDNIFQSNDSNVIDAENYIYGTRRKGKGIYINRNASNVLIQGNEFFWLNNGVSIQGDNHQIIDNYFHDMDRLVNTSPNLYEKFGGYCLGINDGNGTVVRGNRFEKCFGGYDNGTCTYTYIDKDGNEQQRTETYGCVDGIVLDGCAMEIYAYSENHPEWWAENLLIENNYFTKNRDTFEASKGRDIIFRNNIINNDRKLFMIHTGNWGGNGRYEIYNNTFVNLGETPVDNPYEFMNIRDGEIYLQNNIYQIVNSQRFLNIKYHDNHEDLHLNNNLFNWAQGIDNVQIILADNGSHYSLESANNFGFEINSFIADPLFVSVDDFNLQADSPAIDAGANMSGLSNDYESQIRPVDGDENGIAEFDIGAYEYQINSGAISPSPTAAATLTPVPTITLAVTLTPTPTESQSFEATLTPTPNPTQAVSPTITLASSPSPSPTIDPDLSILNFKASLAGVPEIEKGLNGEIVNLFHPVAAGQSILLDILIQNSTGTGSVTLLEHPFVYHPGSDDSNSYYVNQYPIELQNLPAGLYRIYLKGPMHRGIEFCKPQQQNLGICKITDFILIHKGVNYLDFSAVALEVGDVSMPSTQGRDGVVNVKDYSFVKKCLGNESSSPACVARADFNYSGKVTNKDLDLIRNTLSIARDEN